MTVYMPKTPVTFRLSDSLLEAIDAQVEATSSNRTDVVVKALKQFFGLVESDLELAFPDVIQRLTDRVTHLEQVSIGTSKPESDVLHSLTERMTQLELQVAALAAEPIHDVVQSMAERMTAVESAQASLSATATAPDVLRGITERLTNLEEAISSTATAAGESVDPQNVLQCHTERNTDTLPNSLVGQSSDCVLYSQTESNTDTLPTSLVGHSSDGVLHGQTESNTDTDEVLTSARDNTPSTKKSEPGEWLTVKEAFRRLGGDPDNAASVVTSLDGRRKVKFGTFRTLTVQDYKAFGLELSGSRRGAKKPYLRIMAIEFQNKRCQ